MSYNAQYPPVVTLKTNDKLQENTATAHYRQKLVYYGQ